MTRNYGTYLQERNGWFQFLFTVPKDQRRRFGGKRQIRKSLGTKDRRQAIIKAGPYIKQCLAMLEAPGTGAISFETLTTAAEYLEFNYRPAQDYAKLGVQETVAALSKILTAREMIAEPTPIERAALRGAVDIPALPVSKLYARFKEVDPDRVVNKTPEKERLAWMRYESKIKGFVDMMGDHDCLTLTRKMIKDYRVMLIERVKAGDFKSHAANEYLQILRIAWRVVIDHDYDHLGLPDPFEKVNGINMDDAKKREQFTTDEVLAIRELLDDSGVNPELRAIMLIAQNTGCSADELVFVTPDDIVLEHEIPHIKLRPNIHRASLKNKFRIRDVPLVGVAFDEARKFPNGFPTYCTPDGPTSVSAESREIVKKVAPTKSMYCYRHWLGTLLRNSDCKDQYQDAILGHRTKGMTGYYGGAVSLENRKRALEAVLVIVEEKQSKHKP